MKILIRILSLLIFLFIIYLGSIILLGTLSDYKPFEVEVMSQIKDEFPIDTNKKFTALIWNIGYAGLSAEMDFFYDGGKKVRDSEENVLRNIYKISNWLEQNDSIDFIMLQEVDMYSRRSYRVNELDQLNYILAGHYPNFAYNYRVKFVPLPIVKPMGRVESGIATWSSYIPAESIRYSYPGNYTWPKGVFMLDRCFLVNKYPVEGTDKSLLIINLHNSAYDDGSLRLQQLQFLKKFIVDEYSKGNYLVIGGDWNQCPPGFKPEFDNQVFDTINLSFIENNFMATDWKWVFDNTVPSNRRVVSGYTQGQTPVTLIDFFLISPNISVNQVNGFDMGFKYSDHNPLTIEFTLQ